LIPIFGCTFVHHLLIKHTGWYIYLTTVQVIKN
ncbi:hypothetical protein, partial [Plasmodium yoelii yoelii]